MDLGTPFLNSYASILVVLWRHTTSCYFDSFIFAANNTYSLVAENL